MNRAPEPVVAQFEIEGTDPDTGRTFAVQTLAMARAAVAAVLGEGRTVEAVDDGLFNVEIRPAEWEVLDSQGYLELAKHGYTLTAEMP